ncbi:DoxX family protein [Deinococcus altitudinis]|uniref:DoxX family protein n=1 Tax=Deinococcus altitudinis TaxID=468914 RepID=UPI003892A2DD
MPRTDARPSVQHLGPALLAALFVGAGTLHFLRPQIYDGIVPAWAAPGLFPSARSVTLISGVAEVAGGLGMLLPATRPAARWGLALLLVLVFPANLDMARQPEKYGLPAWALWARLPLQPLLIWWVLRAGRPTGKRNQL